MNGLHQEVIAPHSNGLVLHRTIGFARQIDDGDPGKRVVLSNDLRNLQTRAGGHAHIQQDQVRVDFVQRVQDMRYIRQHVHIDANGLQCAFNPMPRYRRIVHHQNTIRLLASLPIVFVHRLHQHGGRNRLQ